MSANTNIAEGWQSHDRPPSLFRRFSFEGYSETSTFLDALGELSKETEYYPDISFGKNYANITIHARDTKAVGPEDLDFARKVNELLDASEKS